MFESKVSKIIGIVVVVILVGGMVTISLKTYSGQPQDLAMVRWAACSACPYSGKMELTAQPDSCPKCKAKTLWPAMRCSKCNGIVAIDTFKFDKERREPYCTKCGNRSLQPILDRARPTAT